MKSRSWPSQAAATAPGTASGSSVDKWAASGCPAGTRIRRPSARISSASDMWHHRRKEHHDTTFIVMLRPDIIPSQDETWWARVVSNHRPLACQASALPLSYAPSLSPTTTETAYEATDIYTRMPRSVKEKALAGPPTLDETPGRLLGAQHYGNFTCGTCRAAAGTSKNACFRNPSKPTIRFPGNCRTVTLYTWTESLYRFRSTDSRFSVAGQLVHQAGERGVGLEIRVILHHHQQPGKGAGQVVGSRDLVGHTPAPASFARAAVTESITPRSCAANPFPSRPNWE